MTRPAWACGTLIICALALVLTGCATVQKILPTTVWRQARVRNEGYSLLYQLLSQESDAAKILIVKHADPPIAGIVKAIANTCGQAKKELESFQKTDRHLNLAMPHLPELEQKTRAAIQSTVTRQLLFSSGKKFEVRFLFTQADAMNYAAHLARVVHDQETDPQRQKFLATVAEHCTTHHDRVMELLKY